MSTSKVYIHGPSLPAEQSYQLPEVGDYFIGRMGKTDPIGLYVRVWGMDERYVFVSNPMRTWTGASPSLVIAIVHVEIIVHPQALPESS